MSGSFFNHLKIVVPKLRKAHYAVQLIRGGLLGSVLPCLLLIYFLNRQRVRLFIVVDFIAQAILLE